mgnify:CR=1 FL=1
MIDLNSDNYYMQQELKEAQKAFEKDEVPIGAVIVANGTIIAKGHNLTEQLNDVTAHAEIQAITASSQYLGAKYLNDCTIYITVQPCVMCSGALNWSQIKKVVYGASDPNQKIDIKTLLHPSTEVISGVLKDESGQLMKDFFKKKRK